jgi:hypothetical protein
VSWAWIPALSEGEKADCGGFLREILQILPLAGLRAFEYTRPVATPQASFSSAAPTARVQGSEPDTIIVPAKEEGFQRVFLGEHQWYAIRISGGMIPKIKWIAAYQSQPVSAVTHVAPIKTIEPYGEGGKYRVVFSEPAKAIPPIPFADALPGSMQGPRYTSYARLSSAKKLADLVGKAS